MKPKRFMSASSHITLSLSSHSYTGFEREIAILKHIHPNPSPVKTMLKKAFFAIALCCPIIANAGPGQGCKYKVIDLGGIEGSDRSIGQAISSTNLTAGYVTLIRNNQNQTIPALFEPQKPPTLIFTDGAGYASDVNSFGEVIGTYSINTTYINISQGFYWKNNTLKSLPSLSDGNTVARAINDRSEIVGWSQVALGVWHAFYYSRGKMTDLGDWGGISSEANDINNKGDIAGVRIFRDALGENISKGIRIRQGKVEDISAIIQGHDVVPLSINDKGDLAGYINEQPQAIGRFGFALIGKRQYILKPAGAISTIALGINKDGDVVGNLFDGGRSRAFLWKSGDYTDLNTLPEVQEAQWEWLYEANAINDDGTIVGVGTKDEKYRTFMLIPHKGCK